MKTDVKKLEDSRVEISVILPKKDFEQYREEVENEAIQNVEIDGFRKGHVPREKALQEISSMRILEEMAQRAISASYLDILEKTKVKAIGQPEIMITKIAENNDLEFKLITAVAPEITLGDYKKIAKKIMKEEDSIEVTDKEIDEAIHNIRKMRAQQLMHEHVKEGEVAKSWNEITDDDLPELNDDFVKTLGNFKDLADFKEKIKKNIAEEKKAKNIEKKRIAIIDAILGDEKTDFDVPQIMVDYELDKMMYEFEGNIAMTGMKFDDYLKSINKTRDDYKKEWREQALKRAKTELLLGYIASKENITVPDEEIEKEVSKILEQYKDQKNIDENNVRAYVAQVLTNQKVFEFLESQK